MMVSAFSVLNFDEYSYSDENVKIDRTKSI